MKKILIGFLFLFVCISCSSQEWSQTKMDSICAVKGHAITDVCATIQVKCPPTYNTEYKDSIVVVYPPCESKSCMCRRCNREIVIKTKERKEVIYKRK